MKTYTSGTHIPYTNNTLEHIEKQANRMVDAAASVKPLHHSSLRKHLALASFMDKETIWRTGQDMLALVAEIRRLQKLVDE